jgi:predicted NACHT family NTPase
LHQLKGHTDTVWGVAFSPDGRRLASTSKDETVRVWDAATGQELLTLKGHRNVVCGVSFSPDGRRLATASFDGTVRVWDADNGQELHTLKGHDENVLGVSFSSDGRRLASASQDQTVRIWDATTGQELLRLKGHSSGVWGVAFSPDGRRLASASQDETVRVWDAATGQELLTLKGHRNLVGGVSFSPDGRRLASAGDDQTVRVWEGSAMPNAAWRRRELLRQAASLLEQLGRRDQVLAALRNEPTLDPDEREFALQVAQSLPEHTTDAGQLNEAAWKVVRTRDAGKDAYLQALSQAEAAVRLLPEVGIIVNTLGVAQYRMGRYPEAQATLTRSEKLNATKDGSHAADLAFLAMTQHQLGKKDEAKATLARLRKVMEQTRWADDPEAVSFLCEAEELIEGSEENKKQ